MTHMKICSARKSFFRIYVRMRCRLVRQGVGLGLGHVQTPFIEGLHGVKSAKKLFISFDIMFLLAELQFPFPMLFPAHQILLR